MTINAMGSVGKVRCFIDFTGEEAPVALTNDQEPLGGGFFIGGEGIEDADTGLTLFDSDGLNGVARIIGGNTDHDCTAIMTAMCFDVGLMGPIIMETRVRMPDLDDKAIFIGFNDVCTRDVAINDLMDAGTTTLTLTASDLVGFYLSSELTDDEDWHGVYNGGSTTGETTSTNVDLDDDAVAGEFQILRLEIDPNGTARWYIDGVLKQTVEGAVSTTTDLGFMMAAGANTTELVHLEPDYILVEANRDWNA